MSVRKILVSDPQNKCVLNVITSFKGEKFSWVYLGKNVARFNEISHLIGDKGSHKDVAEQLQKTAFSIREDYIDYIGNLSLKKSSLKWWAGSLSEKNPFISKTFQNACNLKVALSLIESEKNSDLVFFIESRFLRLSLQDIIEKTDLVHFKHIEPIFSGISSDLKDRYEYFLKHGWFFVNNVARILFVKLWYMIGKLDGFVNADDNNSEISKKMFLIHTWIDNRSFKEEANLNDAYFGKLKDVMKDMGKNVVIVPNVLHTIPYREAILKLTQCSENILIPAMFLNIGDVLIEFISDIKKPSFENYPYFMNVDVSRLIYEDIVFDWKDIRVNSNLLAFHFINNLKNRGFEIEQFTYPYENHTWEKVYCCALRKFYPSTHILGYQHAAISQMYLNYFISSSEFDVIPSPDIILTNGKHTSKILTDAGYNPSKIKVGGAIRYEYLTRLLDQGGNGGNSKHIDMGKYRVLVTTSIDKNESSELIMKSINAYSGSDIYNIIIKCHPLMPFSSVANILSIDKLPGNFEVSESPISTLVNECNILLYTSSTTCIEGLAAGIPILHIGSSFMIDRDVLDSLPNVRTSVKTEEDMRVKVKELIGKYQTLSSEEKDKIRVTVQTIFGHSDEQVYKQFILCYM